MIELQPNYSVLLYIESMTCRVECIRSDTELRMTWRRFSFLVTKDVLQLLHTFLFEFQALIGMECLRWSEDAKYSFDKNFRNGRFFLVRKCDEHSKSSGMIDDS